MVLFPIPEKRQGPGARPALGASGCHHRLGQQGAV